MATVRSNFASTVRPALFGLGQLFNLRRKSAGGNRRFGDEVLDATAVTIANRVRSEQVDADGNTLKKLSPRYKARKIRQGHDGRILVRTGEMTEVDQLLGQTTVAAGLATMTAGLDEETRDKLAYAEDGGRDFYAIGKEEEAAADAVVDESTTAELRRLGGSS